MSVETWKEGLFNFIITDKARASLNEGKKKRIR
jgi:hypothetical protein